MAACSSHPRNLPGSRLLGLLMEKPSRVHCFPEPETDFGLRLERLECAVRVIQEWRERLDSPPDATCPIPQPEPVVVRTAATPERRASSFLWQGNNRDLKLERSIWDASLLAGVKGQKRACAAFAVMLVILNTLVQGFFSYIVNSQLTTPIYTDDNVAQYRSWRINVGHALGHASELSLAARVCSGDAGLESSTMQMKAVKDIERYLPTGPYLQALCCFVWFLGIIKDLVGAIRRIDAVMRLRGQKTLISSIDEGRHSRIEALSAARTACFVTVQLARICIALSLGYGGARLLCNTIQMEGLLRTTVALKYMCVSSKYNIDK